LISVQKKVENATQKVIFLPVITQTSACYHWFRKCTDLP